MKYSPTLYARALFEILDKIKSSERAPLTKNLWQTMKRNGDESLADRVIDLLGDMLVASGGGRVIVVETARELGAETSKQLKKIFGPDDLIKYRLNPRLVAGARFEIDNGMELDYSLSGRLKKMFA